MKEITTELVSQYMQTLPIASWSDTPDWFSQLPDQEKQVYCLARHMFDRIQLRNPIDFLKYIFFAGEANKDRDFIQFTAGIRKNDQVADLGCGWGGLTRRLLTLTPNVIAADHVFEHAIATKLRNPQAQVFQADVRCLSSLAEETIDFTILNDVFEHVGDPCVPRGGSGRNLRQQFYALRELSRITKEQGVVYLSTGNYRFPYDGETHLWFYHWLPPEEQNLYNGITGISADNYWLLTWEEMQQLLSACNLVVETVTTPDTDCWDDMFVDRLEICFRDLHPEMKKTWKRLLSSDPRFFSSWRIVSRKRRTAKKSVLSFDRDDLLPLSESARAALLLFPWNNEEVTPHPLKRMKEYLSDRRVWIWGAGSGGSRILSYLQKAEIPVDGFIDSDPKKKGTRFYGFPVCCPEEIEKERPGGCYIFIASIHSAVIEKQLKEWDYRYWADFLSLNLA